MSEFMWHDDFLSKADLRVIGCNLLFETSALEWIQICGRRREFINMWDHNATFVSLLARVNLKW